MNFEQYLNDFNSTVNLQDFILNFVLVTILALVLRIFYKRFGRAISDRDNFSNNFLILALATFLIITVIKSSIALSLGLVGALSIVRFRAAIKDPEELTYLFLIIGLGVVGGANKPVLALIFFPLVLTLIYFVNRTTIRKRIFKNSSVLHIESKVLDSVAKVTSSVADNASYVELRKHESAGDGQIYSYICRFESVDSIDLMVANLKSQDPDISISIVDQPQLIV